MTLLDQINEDVKAALRSGNAQRKAVLRGLLAAVKNRQVERRGDEVTDDDVLGLLQKEIKAQHETVADAERAGRNDLVIEAQQRIEILTAYLPQQLSPEEITKLAQAAIQATGASEPKQMGMVMKALMPQVRGRADGKVVSSIVSQLLRPDS